MCIVDKKKDAAGSSDKAIELVNLRKALPAKVFEKSLLWSLFYLFFDISMCILAFYSIWTLCHSITWSTLPEWQKGVATVVYWNVCGFFMWGLFVVAHDCGHGTFSNYEALNDFIGHLVHSAILVPYWPWQVNNILTYDLLHFYRQYLNLHFVCNSVVSSSPPYVPQPRRQRLFASLAY